MSKVKKTLGLCMIVKPSDDEAIKLDACLHSCANYFDEIYITQAGQEPNEEVSKVIKKHRGTESFFKWVDDFSAARNYNFSQATTDWIMWLDADDILEGGTHIRKNIELADNNKVSGLYTIYHYKVSNGQVEDKHWKLQIIKNDNIYEWKGLIHEDLLAVRPTQNAKINDVIRVHTADEEDSAASLARNIKMLEKAAELEPNEPRHFFYQARCFLGSEEWGKVLKAVKRYLELSNWKAERADAWNMAGEAALRLEALDEALTAHNNAILEEPDAPDAYIYKARVYIKKQEWENALTMLQIAEQRDSTKNPLKREALYKHDLYVMASIAQMHLGKFEEAVKSVKRARQSFDTERSLATLQLAEEMWAKEQKTLQYHRICLDLLEEPEKCLAVLDTAPVEIQDDPRLLRIRFTVERREWDKDEVAIFCGNSLEDWDGNSIKEGGIGGSETAVIEIAKRLVKAGKKVTVFNRCGAFHDGKEIDGVLYKNFWQFNKEDVFNVLWVWRGTSLLEHDIKAKKVIIDMHDVATPHIFYKEVLDKIDHIFVKTEYHKSLYPTVPEEKFVVVGNGIDLARFDQEAKKDKNKFIYTSTQNRGLEQLATMWPKIKEAIPEAELHYFYGWNTWLETHKDNPAMMDWYNHMQTLLSQEGIVNHGRVDQYTLAKHQLEAGFWLYPTAFPEIHCITALEMQAAGAYPITTGFAALEETQQWGEKLPGDINDPEWQQAYIDKVIEEYNNYDLIEPAMGKKWALDNSWDKVTDTWIKYMNTQ